MSLNHGRTQLAIPGPSVIPERVLLAMHRPSPNIYEGELIEVTHSLVPDLKTVAQTKGDVAIYIANGHGAWEAALRNTIAPGEKVVVIATGRFGAGWGDLAKDMGIETIVLDFGMHSDADPQKLEEVLRADTKGEIKAVLTVQTDTASSVRNDVVALRKAIDAAGHDALYMVDCIACLGCDAFHMDEWSVDVMVAACQKGLMTPAGLGFVYFNDKAAQARNGKQPGFYFDWVPRADPEMYYQFFGGTAPTHHIYGLREALDMMVHEEGLEACWKRHETIARAYCSAVEAWGEGDGMHHNIADKTKRSNAVSTITTGPGEAAKMRKWVEENAGVTLGIGLGFGAPGSVEFVRRFRIGHMGHQNIAMTMGVIGSIDCALKALNIKHGDGALDAASKVLAAH
ncbi:pyridoxal-phosphate-dependent aminotransferase family protein [Pseudahrensia aquimaris]|uniref:Pyridoxal-phosphate-dependent aminotransferase family protein n=1 Tax=Pseudahrensia aquimaris TaxID=744461 RepID=A0ABW3FDT4_9HYPH